MTNTPPTGITPVADPNATQASTAAIADNTKKVKENTDATKEASEEIQKLANQVDGSRAILNLYSGALKATSNMFDGISKSVTDYMKNMNQSTDLSIASMAKFGAAITTTFGVTKSTFGGASFSGINTFRGQLEDLLDPIKNNTTALGVLANSFGVIIPKSIGQSADKMVDFIKGAVGNLLDSADNAVKLQDVYIKAAAATGRLGDAHEAVGPDLQRINQLIRDQRTAISQAAIATNSSQDTVESYYRQLMNLPVAFKAGEDAQTRARSATIELTKSIQLARGMGREYTDIMEDMRTAIRDYNASMPEAMEFTAQISEISKNYNIELKDVQNSLRGTADAFKYFGNEGAGAAEILNEYVGSLKSTGLSGAAATDIVTNMTRQIGQLSIAQKAFLSGQQGGPGGLMGAFDIDMKLRQGKLKEVMDMAKNQLLKMTGPLVSTQEAASSPQAAAQMVKQIQMLRSGPLGAFAKSDMEAEHLIDALKSGRTENFKELVSGQEAVGKATEMGLKYAEQTASGISTMVGLMKAAQGEASFANENTIQAGFTAGTGIELANQNLLSVKTRQAAIEGTMKDAAELSTRKANAIDLKNEISKAASSIPEEAGSVIEGIGNMPGAAPRQKTESYEEYMRQANAAKEIKLPPFMGPQTTGLGIHMITPGSEVANAAASNATRNVDVGHPAGGAFSGQGIGARHAPTPSSAGSSLGDITVHVEGYCLECGEKIKGSDQTFATNVGQKIRP